METGVPGIDAQRGALLRLEEGGDTGGSDRCKVLGVDGALERKKGVRK